MTITGERDRRAPGRLLELAVTDLALIDQLRLSLSDGLNVLANAVKVIAETSTGLQRVVLVTGTKYYGVHLGPVKTPMREADPRHMPPNYYYDQIDWLTAWQKGKTWDWVELRPQTLCGFSPGTAMSRAAPTPWPLASPMANPREASSRVR